MTEFVVGVAAMRRFWALFMTMWSWVCVGGLVAVGWCLKEARFEHRGQQVGMVFSPEY